MDDVSEHHSTIKSRLARRTAGIRTGFKMREAEERDARRIRARASDGASAKQSGIDLSGKTSLTRSTAPRPPWDSAFGFLKRETYILMLEMLESDRGWVIEKAANLALGSYPKGEACFVENPARWTLWAVRGRIKDPTSIRLSGRNHDRFATELTIAAEQQVPSRHLIGFIFQIGGEKRSKVEGEESLQRLNLNSKPYPPVEFPDSATRASARSRRRWSSGKPL